MKFAGLSEIRRELQLLSPKRLQEVSLRLAKFKKDNKDLLAFLLFEEDNKDVFVNELKTEISEELQALESQSNLFYMKKSLRRILRSITRYSKFLDDKDLSLQLYLHFLCELRNHKVPYQRNAQLGNIYDQQLKKIASLIGGIHEDLRQDYIAELRKLAAGRVPDGSVNVVLKKFN